MRRTEQGRPEEDEGGERSAHAETTSCRRATPPTILHPHTPRQPGRAPGTFHPVAPRIHWISEAARAKVDLAEGV
ncbi:hypothetical protein GCM10020254_13050 [Streptomyces goshikiensis]